MSKLARIDYIKQNAFSNSNNIEYIYNLYSIVLYYYSFVVDIIYHLTIKVNDCAKKCCAPPRFDKYLPNMTKRMFKHAFLPDKLLILSKCLLRCRLDGSILGFRALLYAKLFSCLCVDLGKDVGVVFEESYRLVSALSYPLVVVAVPAAALLHYAAFNGKIEHARRV